jgi:phosphatidylserine decarboxylase
MLNGLLTKYPDLRALLEQRLQQAAIDNPHLDTNPVRTIEQWCAYVERFAHLMPWQTMDIGEDASFFRRIDQNIGYFYFLLGDLQYEPRVAQWLKAYNIAWGEWLSSSESWNEDYYQLALSDPLFELTTDRYESPDHWHSWNDFFARKLRNPVHSFTPSLVHSFTSPCDGVIAEEGLIKTASIVNWLDLLGDSPFREVFAGGETSHIVLDVFDYHRFHMPCDGTILECKTIQGIHAGGGEIIWDEEQGRYRYEQCGVTDFQMLETRGVLIIDTPAFGKIAIVPVGVQQVSSVQWTHPILKSQISNFKFQIPIRQGEELGCFLFGGSDIVLFFEPGRAPQITPQNVKVGDSLI